MKMLLVEAVGLKPALLPMATFPLPVLLWSAKAPMAVLPLPVVLSSDGAGLRRCCRRPWRCCCRELQRRPHAVLRAVVFRRRWTPWRCCRCRWCCASASRPIAVLSEPCGVRERVGPQGGVAGSDVVKEENAVLDQRDFSRCRRENAGVGVAGEAERRRSRATCSDRRAGATLRR